MKKTDPRQMVTSRQLDSEHNSDNTLFFKTISITPKIDRELGYLLAFLAIYWFAWTITVGFLPLSLFQDSVEEVVWSQTWQWGYYKHPPLPSMLLAALNYLCAGPSAALTVFAAQGCNVLALFYVWRLAKRFVSPRLALVAVLLTSVVGYHNFRAVTFDHNTVSLPVTAAILYYFHVAISTPQRTTAWVLFGFTSGLALLTKYSAVLVFASFFVYLSWQNLWINQRVRCGLLLSMLICLTVLYPHLQWLLEHNWLPFTYLGHQLTTADDRAHLLWHFFTGQFFRFWYLMLAVYGLMRISSRRLSTIELFSSTDQRFLASILLTPLVLALLPLLINGNFLSRNWVSAFFLPTGLVIVGYLGKHYDEISLLKNTQRLVAGIQVIVLIAFLTITVFYPARSGYAVKTNFPSQEMATQVQAIWQRYQSQPLKIVIADTWLGGNVLLHTQPEPKLLINNDIMLAPWVTREEIEQRGALVLTPLSEKNQPQYAALFEQAIATGEFSLPWGQPPHQEQVQYAWAILAVKENNSVFVMLPDYFELMGFLTDTL